MRQWMQSPEIQGQWLFITVPQDFFHALESLVSCWLSITVGTLLSEALQECQTSHTPSKTWFVLDELPALGLFSNLGSLLARARKRGGCVIAGAQNIHQLISLYGLSEAQDIMDHFQSHIMFRSTEPETLQLLSRSLGEVEVTESQKSLSYGAHAVRDGVSLNAHRRTKRVISPTDIATLQNFQAYIRLPEGLPPTKLTMKRQPTLIKHPSLMMKPEIFLPDAERIKSPGPKAAGEG